MFSISLILLGCITNGPGNVVKSQITHENGKPQLIIRNDQKGNCVFRKEYEYDTENVSVSWFYYDSLNRLSKDISFFSHGDIYIDEYRYRSDTTYVYSRADTNYLFFPRRLSFTEIHSMNYSSRPDTMDRLAPLFKGKQYLREIRMGSMEKGVIDEIEFNHKGDTLVIRKNQYNANAELLYLYTDWRKYAYAGEELYTYDSLDRLCSHIWRNYTTKDTSNSELFFYAGTLLQPLIWETYDFTKKVPRLAWRTEYTYQGSKKSEERTRFAKSKSFNLTTFSYNRYGEIIEEKAFKIDNGKQTLSRIRVSTYEYW